MHPMSILVATLLLAASAAQPVHAENVRQNATGACQAALPAYDGLIRKRPVAIRNEGTAAAYVSCSMAATDGEQHAYAEAIVTNGTDATVSVSCTFVTGRVNSELRYYPVTLMVGSGQIAYVLQNFNGTVDSANLVNASCLLPPNVEINYFHVG